MSPKARGPAGLFLPCRLGAPAHRPRRSLRALPRPAGLAVPHRLGGPSSSAARCRWVVFALPRGLAAHPRCRSLPDCGRTGWSLCPLLRWPSPPGVHQTANTHTEDAMCSAALALPDGQKDLPKEPPHERPCCSGEAAPYMCPATADARLPAGATSPHVTFAPPVARQSCTMRAPVPQQTHPYPGWLEKCVAAALDVLEALYPTTHSPARADARLSCGAGGAPGCSVIVF